MENQKVVTSGMGIGGWLFILFLALKLGVGNTSVMEWSWWWVTCPLWGPFAFFLAIVFVVLFLGGIASIFKK